MRFNAATMSRPFVVAYRRFPLMLCLLSQFINPHLSLHHQHTSHFVREISRTSFNASLSICPFRQIQCQRMNFAAASRVHVTGLKPANAQPYKTVSSTLDKSRLLWAIATASENCCFVMLSHGTTGLNLSYADFDVPEGRPVVKVMQPPCFRHHLGGTDVAVRFLTDDLAIHLDVHFPLVHLASPFGHPSWYDWINSQIPIQEDYPSLSLPSHKSFVTQPASHESRRSWLVRYRPSPVPPSRLRSFAATCLASCFLCLGTLHGTVVLEILKRKKEG